MKKKKTCAKKKSDNCIQLFQSLTFLVALHRMRIFLDAPEQCITAHAQAAPATDRMAVAASLCNLVQLMEFTTRHVRTANAALLHQDTTARRRHRQIGADAQRTHQIPVTALALQARFDGRHNGAVMKDRAVVVAAYRVGRRSGMNGG